MSGLEKIAGDLAGHLLPAAVGMEQGLGLGNLYQAGWGEGQHRGQAGWRTPGPMGGRGWWVYSGAHCSGRGSQKGWDTGWRALT